MASKITSIKDFPEWYFEAQLILAKNKGISYLTVCKMLNDMGYRNSLGNPFTLKNITTGYAKYRRFENKFNFIKENQDAKINN